MCQAIFSNLSVTDRPTSLSFLFLLLIVNFYLLNRPKFSSRRAVLTVTGAHGIG